MSGYFFCHDVDHADAADAKKVFALTARRAVIKFAEQIWAEGDRPNEMTISVQDERGNVETWRVEARPEVNFYAHLKGSSK